MTIENSSKANAIVVEKLIGVYTIKCLQNGRIYVGSSSDVYQRIWGHLAKLRGQSHPKRELAADFQKFGEGAFRFTIEQSFQTIGEALGAEKRMIAEHSASGMLYNTMLVVGESQKRTPLTAIKKAELALKHSYRPIFLKWPSIKAFAHDIGVTPENARVMKLRDYIPAHCWLVVENSALSRGILGVDLYTLASIEAGRNGLLEESIAA